MKLRQRKAKDPVLPLYKANNSSEGGEAASKQSRGITPPPPPPPPVAVSSKRKRSDRFLGHDVLYRVYLPLLLFFGIVFGIAYLTIGGGTRQSLPEIHPKRHYHQHTAGKLTTTEQEDESHASHFRKSKTGKAKTVTAATTTTTAAIHYSGEEGSVDTNHNRMDRKFPKIRCLDGMGYGYLNDDYCDCLDGSDESMTSACSHVRVQTLNFHCLDGTAIIYASRVHDGVKDCLDGSDES